MNNLWFVKDFKIMKQIERYEVGGGRENERDPTQEEIKTSFIYFFSLGVHKTW